MRFGDLLKLSSKRSGSRIVLALDVSGPLANRADRAEALIREIGDSVAGVKINFQLLLPRGVEGLSRLTALCSRKQIPVIADIKLNDIESTNVDTVDLLFGGGFDAVIANPFTGREEGLAGVLERARALEKGVILLVYMSHAGAMEGYALKVKGEPMYMIFARRVRDWRADGAIVSARSPRIIAEVRSALSPEQLILSPGIGVQGGVAETAVRAGTDFAIVGRSIIDAGSPRAVLAELNRSLASL